VTLLALFATADAFADVGLILRQASAHPGETMTVWGGCGEPVYLVSDSFARRRLLVISPPVPRPPHAPPFRLLGRTVCTGRYHYVGDFPDGDWSSWTGYLRFRVPHVRPGLYQLVVFCDTCRRGRAGSLIVSSWLWRGHRRIGATGLRVVPSRPPNAESAAGTSESSLRGQATALAVAVLVGVGSLLLIVRTRAGRNSSA
jgi:hypothetical protein